MHNMKSLTTLLPQHLYYHLYVTGVDCLDLFKNRDGICYLNIVHRTNSTQNDNFIPQITTP